MIFYLNTEGQETIDTMIQNQPFPFKAVSVFSCLFVLVTVLVKVTITRLLPLLKIAHNDLAQVGNMCFCRQESQHSY